MKNLFIKTLLIISFISCKAQTPVFDIDDLENKLLHIPGSYIKDTENKLNPYVGTYIYNDGTKMLKIVLQKKTMSLR